jgi:hypothetical protein
MNLWGEIPLDEVIQTPKAVLEAQAQELSSQTNGVLEGVVVVEAGRNKDRISLRLYIRVPALNNYTYDVAQFNYPLVEFYPCNIYDSGETGPLVAEDEGEFIEILREVLQSDRIKRAIRGLLAQARG